MANEKAVPRSQMPLYAGSTVVALIILYVVVLAAAALKGIWLVNSEGKLVLADFFAFWSTSLQLQSGPPADVYNRALHRAAQVALLGSDYKGHFAWLNPPTFLLAIAPLGLFSYPVAFLAWIGSTLAAYVAALRLIVPSRWTLLAACAFPGAFWTTFVGQNGFVTAALIGATLGLIDRRPVLAGMMLGLLTFKPQFGILFPVALLAGQRWEVILSASVTALGLAVVSAAAYGVEAWVAFAISLSETGEVVLFESRMGVHKLQSFYGAVLWATGSHATASLIQGFIAAMSALTVALIWRSCASLEVKAGSLSVAVLLATPYVLIYDFAILAVPIAFLIRAGSARGFLPGEIPLIVLSSAVVLAFVVQPAPVGCIAASIICLAILRRATVERLGGANLLECASRTRAKIF
jgi:hypothetical protein